MHWFAFKDFRKFGFDFFLIDSRLVQDINGIGEKNTAIFSFIFWLGYNPVRIPTARMSRTKGRFPWTILRKINVWLDTAIGFTYLPVRIISFIGIFTPMVVFAYMIVLLFRFFHFWEYGPRLDINYWRDPDTCGV